MIINRRQMARAKIDKVKNGLAAYAETQEIIDYMKKELEKENISVHIDQTAKGCWFTPAKQK